MVTKQVVVGREHGIHARPAAEIAEICRNFDGKVTICKGCDKADGCSILEVLLLGVEKGSTVEVVVDGNDDVNTLCRIIDVFESGAGI